MKPSKKKETSLKKLHDIGFDFTKSTRIENNEDGKYCRSHIFPVGSIRQIISNYEGLFDTKRKGVFTITKNTIQEELNKQRLAGNEHKHAGEYSDADLIDEFIEMRKGSALDLKGKKFSKTNNPLSDLIPYIILPLSVEQSLNEIIADYAKNNSETGMTSSISTIEGTSAIADPSQFATQHPKAYLKKFKEIVENYSESKDPDTGEYILGEDERLKLLENLDNGINKVKDLSSRFKSILLITGQSCDERGIFGIDPDIPSGTKSGVRQVNNHGVFNSPPIENGMFKNNDLPTIDEDDTYYDKNHGYSRCLSPTGSPKTSRSSSPSVPIFIEGNNEESELEKQLGPKRTYIKNEESACVAKLNTGSGSNKCNARY